MEKLRDTTVTIANTSSTPSENTFTAKRMTDSTIDLYNKLLKK